MKTKIVSCHTADSKPLKQEVNGTVILPPLVFPAQAIPSLTFIETNVDEIILKASRPFGQLAVLSTDRNQE
jgi:hypothetical protein